MNILVIGLNHKTASVEIRERLAFNGPKLEEGLLAIRQLKGVNEPPCFRPATGWRYMHL